MEEKVVSCNQKVVPICFFCNTVPREGISRGFFLKGIFVCGQCEEELISIGCDAQNTEKYKVVIEKLREILFKKSPRKY